MYDLNPQNREPNLVEILNTVDRFLGKSEEFMSLWCEAISNEKVARQFEYLVNLNRRAYKYFSGKDLPVGLDEIALAFPLGLCNFDYFNNPAPTELKLLNNTYSEFEQYVIRSLAHLDEAIDQNTRLGETKKKTTGKNNVKRVLLKLTMSKAVKLD